MKGRSHNYFDMMIERYNSEDFVVNITAEQIQKSAKNRIFREMVKGEIDYAMYGGYFLDPKFLENLIIAAQDELRNKETIYNALRFYDFYHPGSIDVVYNITLYQNLVIVYTAILQRLSSLKYGGDIGILTDIQYVLRDQKKYM